MRPVSLIEGHVSVLDRNDVDTDQIIPKQFLKRVERTGFGAIVAPSFADIFYSNCTKIGLLPVALAESEVRSLMAAGHATIDLAAQEVTWTGGQASFEIDAEIKRRLLGGLDDIGVTLQQEDAIGRFEVERERSGPVTTSLS